MGRSVGWVRCGDDDLRPVCRERKDAITPRDGLRDEFDRLRILRADVCDTDTEVTCDLLCEPIILDFDGLDDVRPCRAGG